ncbi:Phosphoribulokinase / Uridine kinase family protein [Trichomonas vaginalis G3]|uniref:Phosphoribulokinase / Uridine kinase family protein n=1 Tax=Trichomonas vaginalis (strain ATCC PRA-98 / G3) TaxID=412133 RepID=A2F8L4_TRIV3|nr:phosphoribulokinase family protein-related protein family [Trichomonas vaginalis G3]EAX98746.1 Phosphoribulokinase / Uridine kinase family protein [Trichomonas vaginalis G3]KAI5543504.1 phosphoribulokinase family protein-related protein family [Trichomonas vaginalis G3]|eukprot:XP_001311676.1 Phosphoribulokinase / Uridine kinase family protein [Trichomonas vaginalis G3]
MSELDSRFISTDNINRTILSHDDQLQNASLRVKLNAHRATFVFLVKCIYGKLFDRRLKAAHSLADGIYCIDVDGLEITEEMLKKIEEEMKKLISENKFLENVTIPRNELIKLFTANKLDDKVGVLKAWAVDPVPCVRLGEFVDYTIEPMLTDLSQLSVYGFRLYANGIVLRMPTLTSSEALTDWRDPAAQLEMFQEYTQWAKLIGVDTVPKLNEAIFERKVYDLKWVCEGLHQRKLARIAQKLVEGFPGKRVITIAGPSSSNKTTFAKRLAIALRVVGYDSIVIEMDDYFVDREKTPKGPDGKYDFECIGAMNVDVLAENVHKLIKGETILRRKYDFKQGKGINIETEKQTLPANAFLILEGIHGLNPELLGPIGRNMVTPIYVAPLTPLVIDSGHRFPTSDLRLIRRIIRDHKYRGYSARTTIHRWTSVRVGEEKNIFPYQGNAEMFFNSSLVYELPVLSIYGRALLSEATIPEEHEDIRDPLTAEVTQEAKRLLGMLNLFYPIPLEEVPHISCIREFVGGSDLKY